MNYDKEFILKQKEILLREKEGLEGKKAKLQEYQDFGFDDEDNTDEISNYENNLSIQNQIDFLLNRVNKALKAIENGTYGQCAECKKLIDSGRLEIMPYADICVECKENHK